jgi:carboxypeptidase Taq
MQTLQSLRERISELVDLAALEMLATWDHLVMMPAEGAAARARQLATLSRVMHERATAEQIGELLDELEDAELEEIERDVVRLARRDWERARRVPPELAAERAQAQAEGQQVWHAARADDDYAAFAPALRRNVQLARAYGECLDDGGGIYQALLADYDFGLQTDTVNKLFADLAAALSPLVEQASARSPRRALAVPGPVQRSVVTSTLRRIGVDEGSWRVDVSAHPFTAWIARGDTRVTTRYSDSDVESLLSSLHEYGHALYERQIDPALDGTNLARGTSMSVHESQSKLWENHVARHRSFVELLAKELTEGGFAVSAAELHAALSGVERSAIRVSADPLTYPLHIIVRFELELGLIEDRLAIEDVPEAWREAMRRLLGVEVTSDASGALQDIHWGAGSFGYFPSYALGCLIAAALWEAMESEIGPLDEELRRGEVSAIQRWLGENVHRHGRRLDTAALVVRATGAELGIDPFLRYVAPLAADGR